MTQTHFLQSRLDVPEIGLEENFYRLGSSLSLNGYPYFGYGVEVWSLVIFPND